MENTSKPRNSKYDRTMAEKFLALEVLRNNDFNFRKTANQIRVSVSTLRYWNRIHGPSAKEVIEEAAQMADIVEVIENAELANANFMDQSIAIKKNVLAKIEKLIPKQKYIKDLTELLKVLHAITNPDSNIVPVSEAEEVFTQFLIKGPKALSHGKETNQSTDLGDSTE
jgi:hypothetical protein